MPPDYISLSPSSVNTYLQCPKKWFFRYVERRKGITVDTTHLEFGSQIHRMIEEFYGKMLDFDVPTEQNIIDCIENIFMNSYPNTLPKSFLKRKDLIKKKFLKYELNRLYEDKYSYHPVLFEGKFRVGSLNGIIDMYKKDGTIVDFKTGSKAILTDDYKIAGQIYYWGMMETNENVKPNGIIEFPFISVGKVLKFKVTENDMEKLKIKLEEVLNGINNDEYQRKQNQYCNFCEYIISCQFENMCINRI